MVNRRGKPPFDPGGHLYKLFEFPWGGRIIAKMHITNKNDIDYNSPLGFMSFHVTWRYRRGDARAQSAVDTVMTFVGAQLNPFKSDAQKSFPRGCDRKPAARWL